MKQTSACTLAALTVICSGIPAVAKLPGQSEECSFADQEPPVEPDNHYVLLQTRHQESPGTIADRESPLVDVKWYNLTGGATKVALEQCLQCRRGFKSEEIALLDSCKGAGFEAKSCECFNIYCSGLPPGFPAAPPAALARTTMVTTAAPKDDRESPGNNLTGKWYNLTGGASEVALVQCWQCRRGFNTLEIALFDICNGAGFEVKICECFNVYCSGVPPGFPAPRAALAPKDEDPLGEGVQASPNTTDEMKSSCRDVLPEAVLLAAALWLGLLG